MTHVRLIVGLVLIGCALLFIYQNIGIIEIRFLAWSVAMSRSLLLFLVLLVGVAIGWLWHSLALRRAAREERLRAAAAALAPGTQPPEQARRRP
ncbi:MAG TPA: lipopolysaccharide assembly protein LapA domain-containing protein [Burkholderiales bacterium]